MPPLITHKRILATASLLSVFWLGSFAQLPNYSSDGTLLSKTYGAQKAEPLSAQSAIGGENENNNTIGSTLTPTILYSGTTEYSGDFIYKDGKLHKVLFPGGYCTFDHETQEPQFYYFTQDHLGNNRAVVSESGDVEQITHYYPFGGTFGDAGQNSALQQYKYNGKELDRVAGLNVYDYGARQYYPFVPTWDRMDTMCEKYYNISPYVYCGNSPLLHIDKKGEKTVLYATALPGWWSKTFPTHTFLVVYPKNQTPQYFAYGPHGRTSGQLERVFYKQDINVYKGNDTEHLKNAITVNPPKDMSEEDFDNKVIETAKSFGNNENFEYNIWPKEDTEGNCNTSSSTILYKAGVSKSKLDEYREEIKGLVTGFGNIKAWTADEQEKEVERKRKNEELYEKMLENINFTPW